MMSRLVAIAFIAAGAFTLMASDASAHRPSGERQLGRAIVEPAYDDRTGDVIYVMTPIDAPAPGRADTHAGSPLYIVVYPSSAAAAAGTMSCAHEGGDNCPDHGPGIASLAQATVPAVYGHGVWGHDHLLDGPGASDFAVVHHVVVVLFTSVAAANTHITTTLELDDAIEAGDAFMVDTPIVFHGNVVPASTYLRAAPLEPAAP